MLILILAKLKELKTGKNYTKKSQNIMKIISSINKIQNKIQNKADDLFLEPTDYSFISEKYRREITIDGLDTTKLAKTLGKLGHFF